MPVSTSPVPAVASAGGPSADDEHALARRGDERVGALEQADAAEALAPRCAPPRAGARRPTPDSHAEQPRRARPRAGSARSAPSRSNGSSSKSASASTTAGRSRLVEQPPHERLRSVAAAEARARARARRSALGDRPRSADARPPSGQLHRLEQPLLEHGQRLAGHGDGHVAGVGAEGGLGGEARAPVMPARAADDEHRAGRVLVVARSLRAGRAPRIAGVTSRCSVSRWLEPDVGDDDLAGVEAARARPRGRPSARASSRSRRRCTPRRRPRRWTRRRRRAGRPRRPGTPAALISSISARRVRPRLAVEAGAEERVDQHVAARPAVLGGRRARPRASTSSAIRPSPPFAPPPQTAPNDARVREAAQRLLGDRAAGALHQRRARRGRPPAALHLLGGVERLEHQRTSDADRRGELARVRHREVDRPGADALGPRRRAGRTARTDGFGRPAISTSRQAKRARRRSRAPCRPPPCRRSARRSAAPGSAASRSSARSASVKQRSRKHG